MNVQTRLAKKVAEGCGGPWGGTEKRFAIQSIMKQPTNQEQRNEDKKKPGKENPSSRH
jgi:hypothetical protein